jgi:hypothetical protein
MTTTNPPTRPTLADKLLAEVATRAAINAARKRKV